MHEIWIHYETLLFVACRPLCRANREKVAERGGGGGGGDSDTPLFFLPRFFSSILYGVRPGYIPKHQQALWQAIRQKIAFFSDPKGGGGGEPPPHTRLQWSLFSRPNTMSWDGLCTLGVCVHDVNICVNLSVKMHGRQASMLSKVT